MANYGITLIFHVVFHLFSRQLCFSVSGQKNINQVWDPLNTGSNNAQVTQVTLRNAINQLLSWPQSTRSHRQHFSSQCAQLIAIAVSCLVSRLCLTIGSLGPTRLNEGHPTQKTDHCMLFSKGLPAVDQNPSKTSTPFWAKYTLTCLWLWVWGVLFRGKFHGSNIFSVCRTCGTNLYNYLSMYILVCS